MKTVKFILFLLVSGFLPLSAQTLTPILGGQVRQQRNLTSGAASNLSLTPLVTEGQEFINFNITNPVTGTLGCPDNAPWDSFFGYDSVNDSIGLTAAYYSWLASNYFSATDATTLQAQVDANEASAFSGVYADLTGKPTLFDGAYSSLTGAPTNLSAFTNGPGYITGINSGMVTSALGFTPLSAEVDGSVTNEIELPTQTGQSGKVLSTNGTSSSWITPNPGTVTSVGLTSSTLTITGSPITSSGSFTAELSSTGTAGTYSGVTTDAQGRVTAGTVRAFSASTPTLNSAAVLDASRDTMVYYTVDISVSSLLLGSASGSVILEYADNSGMTTNLVQIASSINSTGGVLNVVNIGSGNVSGVVPAGKYRRIRTVVNSGTATFTARASQEIKL